MQVTCGDCGKRFSTADVPAPGRAHRIRCQCGNAIVVRMDARAQTRPPPLPASRSTATPSVPPSMAADDPFLRAAMDAPLQEPAAPAAASSGDLRPLARRDPDYAERDQAPEPSGECEFELPETTRETRLAGTRAFVLDATARFREGVGVGLRQLLRKRRLVAGGAAVAAVAFALGVWVGAGSVASRWKAKAASAAARAEARPGTAETSPGSVAVPGAVAAPAAALAPAAMAGRGAAPSRKAPAAPGPTRRRDAPRAEPAAVRPAASAEAESIGKPGGGSATAEPKTLGMRASQGPTPARNPSPDDDQAQTPARMPKARETATANPSDGRGAEAASEPTLAASVNHAPDAGAAPNPEPAAAEPADAPPGK